MPWGAAVGGVISAGANLLGSSSAKKAQKKAAKDALNEHQREYDTARSDNLPALNARNSALDQMRVLSSRFGRMPTAEEVMATPGYKFGADEGMKRLNNNAAATGALYSGAQLKSAGQWGTDYATTKYDDAVTRMRANEGDQFDRERSIATGGQAGASTIAQAGTNAANNSSDIFQNSGNAQGAAAISQGNIIANAVNQGASWWNNRQQPTSYTTPNANGSYNNPVGNDGYGINNTEFRPSSTYADGGPVRRPGYAYGGRVGWPQVADPAGVDGAPAWPVRPRMGTLPTPGPQAPVPGRMWRAPTPGRQQAFADGGRVEPKVGTRAPARRGGTGGGLNDFLTPPPQPSLPTADPVRLPPNFLFNPRGVVAAREQQVSSNFIGGGPALGGPPGRDTIDAKLDNGEHVIEADAVTALGDGSNELGQERLNLFRAALVPSRSRRAA